MRSVWLPIDQSRCIIERIGTVELADVCGVTDDPGSGVPDVKLITGRFHHELRAPIGDEIQVDLMCGARTSGRDRSRETNLYRSMQVAAKNALDLRVTRDDGMKYLRIREPDLVHMTNPCHEGRMMHYQYRRAPRLCAEDAVEPLHTF